MTDFVMPQLGETVVDGTIMEWLVAVGDVVGPSEAVALVSTDKVDTEIAAPVEGILTEIRAAAGSTVDVGEVIAVIGGGSTVPTVSRPPSVKTSQNAAGSLRLPASPDQRLSPVVRRLCAEHQLDPASIVGSGPGGRITRTDVLAVIEERPTGLAPKPRAVLATGVGQVSIDIDCSAIDDWRPATFERGHAIIAALARTAARFGSLSGPVSPDLIVNGQARSGLADLLLPAIPQALRAQPATLGDAPVHINDFSNAPVRWRMPPHPAGAAVAISIQPARTEVAIETLGVGVTLSSVIRMELAATYDAAATDDDTITALLTDAQRLLESAGWAQEMPNH